jgi:hypothetical protein
MKKIMFNDRCGLTQAVLEGRKTQTRRIAYMPNGFIIFDDKDFQLKKLDNGQALLTLCNNEFETAHYKIGEEVAIAQRYSDIADTHGQELAQLPGWNNKMFVKADLMPHRIRITNIRVERLQDISEEDCMEEGIVRFGKEYVRFKKEYCYTCQNYAMTDFYSFSTPREAYAALIDKISGKGTWENNPWVFVYDFELVK